MRLFIASAGMAIAILSSVSAQAARPVALHYKVSHPSLGDIGTYSNTIEHDGDVTTVLSESHLKVSLLGLVVYREDAERTERWQGERLVYFLGTTTKDGHTEKVQGAAQGEKFVISSDSGGTLVAPPTVVPANPWSKNFLASDTIMRVDTGSIEHVKVSTGTDTSVSLHGVAIPTHEYQVDGTARYKVWLDDHNVPVRFDIKVGDNEVSFTLTDQPSPAP